MAKNISGLVLFMLTFGLGCGIHEGFMDIRVPVSPPPPIDVDRFGAIFLDVQETISTTQQSESFTFSPVQVNKSEVDIPIGVDNSSSMVKELGALKANMDAFLLTFLTDPLAPDVHVWVIAGDNSEYEEEEGLKVTFPNSVLNRANFEFLNLDIAHPNRPIFIGSENGLGILWDFAVGYLKPIKLQRRPNAKLYALIITDASASGASSSNPRGKTAQQFIDGLKAYPNIGPISINGFIGIDKTTCPSISSVGSEYIKLAAMPEYGGQMDHICNPDWGKMFASFGASVKSQNPSTAAFNLTGFSTDKVFSGVQVNGVFLNQAQYTFDPNTAKLTIPSTVPLQLGDSIVAGYSKTMTNIDRNYSVTEIPDGATLEEVDVDGMKLDASQYVFDLLTKSIHISNGKALQKGQTIKIIFKHKKDG